MNASNRTLGRVLLIVIGLVLIAGGLLAIALVTLHQAASMWASVASTALTPFGLRADREASVLAWSVALGVAIVVGVCALVVIGTRGGGRIDTVLEDDGSAAGVAGSVRIDSAAVEHALSSAIGAMPQVSSLAVDVFRVRRSVAIRVKVRPKRGVPPRDLIERLEAAVADLDALLGSRLPVLVQIARGGHDASRRDRVH